MAWSNEDSSKADLCVCFVTVWKSYGDIRGVVDAADLPFEKLVYIAELT